MRVPLYQVDAFTDELFRGNPAAVCVLPRFPDDAWLQAVASENNLSETAFVCPAEEGRWSLRWFTPVCEVELCGHATLAAAAAIRHYLDPGTTELHFHSPSGDLRVDFESERLVLDFPARPPAASDEAEALADALGAQPTEAWVADYHMAVFPTEADVAALSPLMDRVAALGRTGIIATAPGDETDFVSRFFAPAVGIPEDPVTGSAHCTLIPYWAERLGKSSLTARQISARVGELACTHRGDRVGIGGHAVIYLEGAIAAPPD